VLAISGLLGGAKSNKDHEDFQFTGQLLAQLRDSGSFPAMEFCHHLESMMDSIQTYLAGQQDLGSPTGAHAGLFSTGNLPQTEDALVSAGQMTSEMALAEPSIEEFLLQSEQNIAQMEIYFDQSRDPDLYWPI
jgi:hypothetical protein